MDTEISVFRSSPIGSLVILEDKDRLHYLELLFQLPPSIRMLVFGPSTSAFIRGLAKTYNIDLEKAPKIAFAVLQIAIGEKTLAQLGSILSTELQVANDVAQKIANEIEKELFAPIALELNQYLARKKQTPSQSTGGARNVLNLKNNLPLPPPPPPIPKTY